MTPESQRIAIAEACPFVKKAQTDSPLEYDYAWFDKRGHAQRFDPLDDLNAMHEAEKVLKHSNCGWITEGATYIAKLENVLAADHCISNGWSWALTHANAAQRAEAFLRTLGLWKDDASHLSTVDSRIASIKQKK